MIYMDWGPTDSRIDGSQTHGGRVKLDTPKAIRIGLWPLLEGVLKSRETVCDRLLTMSLQSGSFGEKMQLSISELSSDKGIGLEGYPNEHRFE